MGADALELAALPSALTPFIGRSAERAALTDALRTHRLVTATGPGGVGKTRLCLAVAEQLADEYDDGVAFVDLVTVTDDAMVVAASPTRSACRSWRAPPGPSRWSPPWLTAACCSCSTTVSTCSPAHGRR